MGEDKKKRKVKNMTGLQKLVKRYWPNESTLVKMRTRREDVTARHCFFISGHRAFDADPGDTKRGLL